MLRVEVVLRVTCETDDREGAEQALLAVCEHGTVQEAIGDALAAKGMGLQAITVTPVDGITLDYASKRAGSPHAEDAFGEADMDERARPTATPGTR
jgi:hypothetical protein